MGTRIWILDEVVDVVDCGRCASAGRLDRLLVRRGQKVPSPSDWRPPQGACRRVHRKEQEGRQAVCSLCRDAEGLGRKVRLFPRPWLSLLSSRSARAKSSRAGTVGWSTCAPERSASSPSSPLLPTENMALLPRSPAAPPLSLKSSSLPSTPDRAQPTEVNLCHTS